MQESLSDLLEGLDELEVAVVGDVMLDRFVHGRVDRISPEAPVPVVHVEGEEERLGGAANVALNVAALGARTSLFGVIGEGEAADALLDGLGRTTTEPHLLRIAGRPTTLKTRILGGTQQITRIDRETREPLAPDQSRRFLDSLRERGPFDAVIVSDYHKGVISPELMALLREWFAEGTVVVVDPKRADFDFYRGVTCLTPNAREAAQATQHLVVDDRSAAEVGRRLRESLQLECLLLTRGEQGMTVVERDAEVTHLPADATEVFDVTGAGDTVIATFATLLAAGVGEVDAARVANLAAGQVVRELGTAVVDAGRLVLDGREAAS